MNLVYGTVYVYTQKEKLQTSLISSKEQMLCVYVYIYISCSLFPTKVSPVIADILLRSPPECLQYSYVGMLLKTKQLSRSLSLWHVNERCLPLTLSWHIYQCGVLIEYICHYAKHIYDGLLLYAYFFLIYRGWPCLPFELFAKSFNSFLFVDFCDFMFSLKRKFSFNNDIIN
jgi:hypothetical protein